MIDCLFQCQEPAFLHYPIAVTLCGVMNLLCFCLLDCRRFETCSFKGHTRDGLGVDKRLVFCRFGAKVTENKIAAVCQFSMRFPIGHFRARIILRSPFRLTAVFSTDRFQIAT